MKTVVVTGGAGFLGSHLCEKLLDHGCRVICVDNLFTGSKRNIGHLQSNPRFHFIHHDIIDPLFVEKLGFEQVDQVYNLACPASPVHYQFNAIRTIKANTLGVINMLGLAKRHNARILQASTSEVYGDPLEHPQTESYRGNTNTIGPRACYDEGKRVAETLMFDYHRQHQVDIRVARIFNTYGPRMAKNDGRVISNFIVQALAGEDITVYGDGSQTRSFCFVSDLIDGLMKLMDSEKMDSEKIEGPVNLGNPQESTILEIAKMILELTNSPSKIVFRPLPVDDPCRRRPDISLAQKSLHWEPKVGLEMGLQATIKFFQTAEVRGEENQGEENQGEESQGEGGVNNKGSYITPQ